MYMYQPTDPSWQVRPPVKQGFFFFVALPPNVTRYSERYLTTLATSYWFCITCINTIQS